VSRILLLRHAESRPEHDRPESDWPLSDRGRLQSQQLIAAVSAEQPQHLFSSPYLRARDTLAPAAHALGRSVVIEPALRECAFRSGFAADWPAPIARAWSDRGYASDGCESADRCQTRVVDCVRSLAVRCAGRSLLICSHGNAIALLLNAVDPSFGYTQWREMTMPALYELDLTARDFRVIPLDVAQVQPR
jgi:2,3-bisphosphoglycerate-dependent phosphoglycerate mutase